MSLYLVTCSSQRNVVEMNKTVVYESIETLVRIYREYIVRDILKFYWHRCYYYTVARHAIRMIVLMIFLISLMT